MTDVGEAIEGVVALVMGGFILLLVGSSLESTVNYDLSLWGGLLILSGVILAIAVVATIIGGLIGR